jgi:hypothetical protein
LKGWRKSELKVTSYPDDPADRGGRAWVYPCLGAAVVVFYVLSFGPALRASRAGIVPRAALVYIYKPLQPLLQYNPLNLGRCYCVYLDFWIPAQVFVSGEVMHPGWITWKRGLTLTKAITLAGGFTEFANKKRLEISHVEGTPEPGYWDAASARTNAPLLQPGDTVRVGRSLL